MPLRKMISYASNYEDVLLNRVFADQVRGCYIDVGSYSPIWCSLTYHFYQRGWSGVNIEPNPSQFREFPLERPRDINLNVGLSDRAGKRTFFAIPDEPGLSTFVPEQAEQYRGEGRTVVEHRLAVLTLADVCARHVQGEIDILSVDVEGHERAVLLGGDWQRWRPRVLVIEATRPWSTEPTHQLWEDIVLAANYRFAHFDGLNRYYVREEDRALLPRLATPVSILDGYEPFVYRHHIDNLNKAVAEAHAQLRQAQEVIASLTQHRLLSPGAVPGRPLVRRVAGKLKRIVHAALARLQRPAA
jgi:FkbM family methyltransferase